jgi:protein phosphatase methylesterase 1
VRDRSTADASTSERAVAAALEPVAWDAYFDEKLDVRGESDADVFRVYARRGGERVGRRSDRLHDATATETDASRSAAGEKRTETVVLFAHGCAYTALSWATTIANLATRLDSSVVLAAFDARHHGATRVSPREKINDGVDDETSGDDVDVSAERLARDVASVARAVVGHFARSQTGTKENGSMGFRRAEPEPTAEARARRAQHGRRGGRARGGDDWRRHKLRDARFRFARRRRRRRRRGFGDGGVARRGGVARATTEFFRDAHRRRRVVRAKRPYYQPGVRAGLAPSQIVLSNDRFVWIADARRTAPHWRGWFQGLSRLFLSLKCAKLLIVADTDRLDTELTIAQMQGKVPDRARSQRDARRARRSTIARGGRRRGLRREVRALVVVSDTYCNRVIIISSLLPLCNTYTEYSSSPLESIRSYILVLPVADHHRREREHEHLRLG